MDKSENATLHLIEHGFQWAHRSQSGSLSWDQVRSIRAFKRDVFIYDLICVSFELNDASEVEIHEQMDGFMTVVEAVQKQFSGIDADWYRKIMLPVFEPTETMLWQWPG